MEIRNYFLLILILSLVACGSNKTEQNHESVMASGIPDAGLKFAKKVSEGNLKIHTYDLFTSRYPDILTLFETEKLLRFSSLSHKQSVGEENPMNYEDCILFVASYQNPVVADSIFREIKYRSEIRAAELEGMAGLWVEQAFFFERIRKTGAMITRKGKDVFFLVESCEAPPVEENWKDYENLFVEFITDKEEEIEVFNADCNTEEFIIERMKVGG